MISPLNAPHPEGVSAADMDGPVNEATRRLLFARAADEGLYLAGSHLAVSGIVEHDGDAFAIRER
jgi:hypothetical protein